MREENWKDLTGEVLITNPRLSSTLTINKDCYVTDGMIRFWARRVPLHLYLGGRSSQPNYPTIIIVSLYIL